MTTGIDGELVTDLTVQLRVGKNPDSPRVHEMDLAGANLKKKKFQSWLRFQYVNTDGPILKGEFLQLELK
jgi:hypothetical protein